MRYPKVVVAPDSFKGSLSSPEAAEAIANGWRRVFPAAELILLPVADGGEGTAHTLATATGGTTPSFTVTGPRHTPVEARLGVLGGGHTVVVELAQAAGITLMSPGERDPKFTSTYGVGELIRHAVRQPGVAHLIIALGGSATNDGGAGLLQALGVLFLDHDKCPLDAGEGGAVLSSLGAVDFAHAERFPRLAVSIACDVDAPLRGPRGASAVFGPQKGATPGDVDLLDAALATYATVMTAATRRDVASLPGAGAAGGAAAGLLWLFPQATLRPGIELVLDAVDFDEAVKGADVVLTGEGRLDSQTLGGKVIAGVARRAKRINPAVFVGAFVGSVAPDVTREHMDAMGLDAVMPLPPGPMTLDEALADAATHLVVAAERAARWYRGNAHD